MTPTRFLLSMFLLLVMCGPAVVGEGSVQRDAFEQLGEQVTQLREKPEVLQAMLVASDDADDAGNNRLRELLDAMHKAYDASKESVPRDPEYLASLHSLYESAQPSNSYRGLVFRTLVKQMLIEAAWAEIRTQPDDARLRAITKSLRPLTLSADELDVLVEEQWEEPDELANTLPADPFRRVMKRIRLSHEEDGFLIEYANWGKTRGGIERATTEALLFDEEPALAANWAVQTERCLRVNTRGAAEYLLRGGDPGVISPADVRELDRVISRVEAQKFAFEGGGVRALYEYHLHEVFDYDRSAIDENFGVPKSWAARIFTPDD